MYDIKNISIKQFLSEQGDFTETGAHSLRNVSVAIPH